MWPIANTGLPGVFLVEAVGIEVNPLLKAFLSYLWDGHRWLLCVFCLFSAGAVRLDITSCPCIKSRNYYGTQGHSVLHFLFPQCSCILRRVEVPRSSMKILLIAYTSYTYPYRSVFDKSSSAY